MNVIFTDEQLKMLLSNENFRKELVGAIANKVADPYSSNLRTLVSSMKESITKGLLRKAITDNPALIEKIDIKVEEVLEKFISSSIGKVVMKSMLSEKKEQMKNDTK